MKAILLPDCGADLEAFYLTLDQRRELLLLLAEKGEAGIAEFVRRHEHEDTTLARKIKKIREKLLREADELRRRLQTDYERRREDEQSRYEQVLRRLRQEAERNEEQRRRLELELPSEIERRIRELPIVQMAVEPRPRLSWWRRAYNNLWRLLRAIWLGLLRLFLPRRPEPKPRAIAIGVPGLRGPGIQLEMDLETALLSNPDLRRRIRKGMGETFAARTRRMWRILLGIENYAEVAQEILEREAERAVQKQAEAAEAERRRLSDAITKDRGEAAKREQELKDELAQLDRAEAAEEAKLRETLAREPLREAERLVTDELEAAGLVDRLASGLRLTARFLDTFAALVYTQESKGVGARRESALGSSIEGEGILEKSRLLSFAETSHMDTVGTLVAARTNHPHVRHLTEDDVVVYREQRSSQTHLVIIVDQSLSMEENDRIVAAKRAALALYHQSRRHGSRHKIDFILMETSVRRAGLAEVWDAKPKGFTNVGRALQVAAEILERSRANRRLLFLVTDGLPEAITIDGKDVAAKPDEALAYALRHANRLRNMPGLSFSIILLEAKDPVFLASAEKIAKKVGGRVAAVEPGELAKSLLVQVRQEEVLPLA